MKSIQIGSTGELVKKIQQSLNITVDGKFGKMTQTAVNAWKENCFLPADGVVHEKEFKYIINDFNMEHLLLSENQYMKTPTRKRGLCVHHTAGWVLDKTGKTNKSFFWGWQETSQKVGTHFSIAHDGTLFVHLDPKYWIYHLGLQGTRGFVDMSTFGVELLNEGKVFKGQHGEWRYWAGKVNREITPIKKVWRGGEFWAPYSNAQIDKLAQLTAFLIDFFGVPNTFVPSHLEFYTEYAKGGFNGIYSHSNVRADKTDVSPAFPWDEYVKKVNLFLQSNVLTDSCHDEENILVSESDVTPIPNKEKNENQPDSSVYYKVSEIMEMVKNMAPDEINKFIEGDERKTIQQLKH